MSDYFDNQDDAVFKVYKAQNMKEFADLLQTITNANDNFHLVWIQPYDHAHHTGYEFIISTPKEKSDV